MKHIISIVIAIIIAVIAFYAIGFSLFWTTEMSEKYSVILASFASIIAFGIIFVNLITSEISATIAGYVQRIIKDAKETLMPNDSNQAEYFSVAEEEYDSGNIDKKLWSLALVKAKGDENLRKVEYMKLRVKQLKKM